MHGWDFNSGDICLTRLHRTLWAKILHNFSGDGGAFLSDASESFTEGVITSKPGSLPLPPLLFTHCFLHQFFISFINICVELLFKFSKPDKERELVAGVERVVK
jgi:hypothetical protein